MDLMMDGLKAEINTLERQGQQPSTGTKKAPEQPLGVVAIPSEAVIAQPLPGTVPIEGEITEGKNEVSIYGFAMLDSGIWVVGDGLKEFANVCWKRNCQHLNGHGQSSQSDPEESTAR
jgi:hypothetical protein